MTSHTKAAQLSANEIVSLIQVNEKLCLSNTELHDENAKLKKQLAWFKNQVFGQTSEKRLIEPSSQQQDLLGEFAPAAASDIEKETITYERKKRQKNRGDAVNETGLRFDDSVEVQEIRVAAPELEGPDADRYEVIDEHITCRLAKRRSSYVVLKYIQPVVKEKASGSITTHSAPTPVFEKSIADVSLLVGLLIAKFLYHQPLYRQHQALLLDGVTLSRSTLTNYVHRTAQLLQPIYDAMLKNMLMSKVLSIDETPTKAGRKQKGKMQQAWFWAMIGESNEMVFHYANSRARRIIDDLLKGFEGALVTDGYGVYASYVKAHANITHAQCWMHNRRGYHYATDDEPEACEHAMELIAKLYAHDTFIKKSRFDHAKALEYRLQHCTPIVDTFFDWVETQCHRADITPSSPFGKAVRYSRNHEQALRVFLGDPTIPMDTGAVERGIRPMPMGARNWLFNWSEVGAHYTAVIQSLIVSCRMNGIHPRDYLVDVLQRIDQHPASQIDELTPSQWADRYGNHFLRSDVDGWGQ